MASTSDDHAVGGQLTVGAGFQYVLPLGIGPTKANGTAYIEGPAIIGSAEEFPNVQAALMVGLSKNAEAMTPIIPGALCTGNRSPYSLCVRGDAAIFDHLDVAMNISSGLNIIAQGEVMSRCGGHILSAKKNFDIPHPSKEGWRLRHTCPEGPSNDVYVRGKVLNRTEIELPSYWKDLVDFTTITVSLTPIGAHQDVIVKRIDEQKVYLQAKGGMPIHCFYHIFGERKDGERLIPEYQGETPEDYPGNNDEYSVSGYHYDRKK